MNVLPKELLLNGDLWTALAGISNVALATLIVVAAAANKPLNRRWVALCLVGAIAGITGTAICGPHPNDVLVQSSGTQLLLSPFEGAEVKALLEFGENVRAEKPHGDFAYVTTPSGTAGWVQKDELSRYVGKW